MGARGEIGIFIKDKRRLMRDMSDYRAREEYKTRREPCGANKQLQG